MLDPPPSCDYYYYYYYALSLPSKSRRSRRLFLYLRVCVAGPVSLVSAVMYGTLLEAALVTHVNEPASVEVPVWQSTMQSRSIAKYHTVSPCSKYPKVPHSTPQYRTALRNTWAQRAVPAGCAGGVRVHRAHGDSVWRPRRGAGTNTGSKGGLRIIAVRRTNGPSPSRWRRLCVRLNGPLSESRRPTAGMMWFAAWCCAALRE